LRRINRATTLASVVALLLVGDQPSALPSTSLVSPANRRWQEHVDLSDGDLFFRTGRDLMSRLVLSQGQTPRFSHVGLTVKIGPEVFVIHAVPRDGHSNGGVLLEPLARFASVANAADVGVYRIRGITNDARARIREYVLRQVGKPFDDAFSLSDDRRMYCTELVLKALAAGGIDLAATVPYIRVMLLTEPVVPPDSLRLSPLVQPLGPNGAVARTAGSPAFASAAQRER
jgi:hypothetical protein